MQMMSRNVVVSGTWHYHVLFINSLLRRFTQLLVVNHEQFFLCKWHTKASITTLDSLSGWKSSPGKTFHRNSSEARTSTWNPVQATSTAAKVTLSTERQRLQRLQTFTEAATKYYNYTENETDEERDHQLPIIQDNRIRNESDGERQRLKFTFKLIFFDTTIGSKNLQLHEEKKNAHEEYLSSGLRTADQPFDHN